MMFEKTDTKREEDRARTKKRQDPLLPPFRKKKEKTAERKRCQHEFQRR